MFLTVAAGILWLGPANVQAAADFDATPITVQRKLTHLTDIAEDLERQADARFIIDVGLRDLKATVLVRQAPLGKVLRALESTFRCEWVTEVVPEGEKPLFRFRMSNASRLLVEDFIKLDDSERSRAARSRVAEWAAAADYPFEELPDRIADLRSTSVRLLAENTPQSIVDGLNLQKQMRALVNSSNPAFFTIGHLVKGLDEEGRALFWQGHMAYGSTNAGQGVPRLPHLLIHAFGYSTQRPKLVAAAKYDPTTHVVRGIIYFQDGKSVGWQKPTLGGVVPDSLKILSGHPFMSEVRAWGMSHRQIVGSSELAKTIPYNPEPLNSTYDSGRLSDADHQEWLHRRTNMSIVSDAFRIPHAWSQPTVTSGPVAHWLTAYLRATGGAARIVDGMLCIRRPEFWRHRQSEISESALNLLEATEPSQRSLSQYADLVKDLSPFQIHAVRSPQRYLTRFSQFPIEDGLPLLRLYAILTDAQKRQLASRGAVGTQALNLSQLQKFREAVLEGMLDGGVPIGNWKDIFDQHFDIDALEDTGIFLSQKGIKAVARVGIDGSEPPAPNGMRFSLGHSPENGIAFTFEQVRMP